MDVVNYDWSQVTRVLNLTLLESRRTIADLSLLLKIVNHRIDCGQLVSSVNLYVLSRLHFSFS